MVMGDGPIAHDFAESIVELEVDLQEELTMNHMYMDQLYFVSLIKNVDNDKTPLAVVMKTELDRGDIGYGVVYRDPRI